AFKCVRGAVPRGVASALHIKPCSLPLAVLIRRAFPYTQSQADLWRFANACTGRQAVRYGERQRPEHRSKGLLIKAQVADAPRTGEDAFGRSFSFAELHATAARGIGARSHS